MLRHVLLGLVSLSTQGRETVELKSPGDVQNECGLWGPRGLWEPTGPWQEELKKPIPTAGQDG